MFKRFFKRNLSTLFGVNNIKPINLINSEVFLQNQTPLITTSILGPICIKINEKIDNKYKSQITLIYNKEYSFNADIVEKNKILGFIHKGLFNPFYYEKRLVVPSIKCECKKNSGLIPKCSMLVESDLKDGVLEQKITYASCNLKKNET